MVVSLEEMEQLKVQVEQLSDLVKGTPLAVAELDKKLCQNHNHPNQPQPTPTNHQPQQPNNQKTKQLTNQPTNQPPSPSPLPSLSPPTHTNTHTHALPPPSPPFHHHHLRSHFGSSSGNCYGNFLRLGGVLSAICSKLVIPVLSTSVCVLIRNVSGPTVTTYIVVFTFGGADYELTRNLVISTSSEICLLLG